MTVLAAVVFVFWVCVFLQTIYNVATAPRLHAGDAPDAQPFLSVVIPARDEAANIGRTVHAFLAQDYTSFEVIVVDDRSTDGTSEILHAISDPRLRVIHGSETPDGWLGKPWALDQGSRAARGEIVLLVDADIIYAPQALRAAVADIEKHDVAMVGLLPHIEMVGLAEHTGLTMLAIVAFMGVPLTLANRLKHPILGLGGGTGNLVRRKDLEEMGYFTPLRDKVIDDVGVAWQLRMRGKRTRAVRADELVSVRIYRGAGEIVRGFTKNMFAVVKRSYLVGFAMLGWMFVLHVLPFVLAVMGNWTGIATVVLIVLARLILFASLRYPLWAAVFLHPFTMVMWAYILLRSMWITGVRGKLEWRGRTYDAAKTER